MSQQTVPSRRPWTREEYERASQLGLFAPDERLELIEGEIVQKMPQSAAHRTSALLVEAALRQLCPDGFVIQVQMPLALAHDGEPEPDVAVIRGSIRDFADRHPGTAALIVEIADTSLLYDRTTKAQLYAQADVPDYWIVNLQARVVEVLRDPGPGAEQPVGYTYRQKITVPEHGKIAPLAAPDKPLLVDTLLP